MRTGNRTRNRTQNLDNKPGSYRDNLQELKGVEMVVAAQYKKIVCSLETYYTIVKKRTGNCT